MIQNGVQLMRRLCYDQIFSSFIKIYRIGMNATLGFHFPFWVFEWGSIQIWSTWGCIWGGVRLISSRQSKLNFSIFLLLFNHLFNKRLLVLDLSKLRHGKNLKHHSKYTILKSLEQVINPKGNFMVKGWGSFDDWNI